MNFIGGQKMVLLNFEENLQKYAKLLVAKGLHVQQDDWVKVSIAVDQAPLVRLITKQAYDLGEEKVLIIRSVEELNAQHYSTQPGEVLTNIPKYKIEESEDHVLNHRVCRLTVLSNDPGLLNEVDPSKVAAFQKVAGKAFKAQRVATQNDDLKWTVAAAAGT